MEQKIVITNVAAEINYLISDGWKVVSITPQYPSTGGSSHLFGGFCFFARKKFINIKL
jgi:hypothetical protein